MKIKWRNVLIVLGLVLAVFLLVDFNRRMVQLDRLTTELKTDQVEATMVVQTQTSLASAVAYATSGGAVEQWAYENGMVRPSEYPVGVLPGTGGTSTPVFTQTPASEKIPIWRIWWELFFGNHE